VQTQIGVRVEQSAVVAAGLAATVAATAGDVHVGVAAVVACAATEAVLAISLATLLSDRRACVLDLIAQGRDALPIAVVQHERRRLMACSHRRDLARSLHALAAEAPIRLARPSRGGRCTRRAC
jgi:hypothetical protein